MIDQFLKLGYIAMAVEGSTSEAKALALAVLTAFRLCSGNAAWVSWSAYEATHEELRSQVVLAGRAAAQHTLCSGWRMCVYVWTRRAEYSENEAG